MPHAMWTLTVSKLLRLAEPRLHGARYYGHYSCVAQGRRARTDADKQTREPVAGEPAPQQDAQASSAERCRLRHQWARRLRRIFEVDPLPCTNCITNPPVVEKILRHLATRQGSAAGRGPPDSARPAPGQRIA